MSDSPSIVVCRRCAVPPQARLVGDTTRWECAVHGEVAVLYQFGGLDLGLVLTEQVMDPMTVASQLEWRSPDRPKPPPDVPDHGKPEWVPKAKPWWRRARRRVLRIFAAIERPAAWLLLTGGLVTFVAVAANLITTGVAKWATLLVAADLVVSGFTAVGEAEDDD